MKTIPDWASVHTYVFKAVISETERSCAAPIVKVDCHIHPASHPTIQTIPSNHLSNHPSIHLITHPYINQPINPPIHHLTQISTINHPPNNFTNHPLIIHPTIKPSIQPCHQPPVHFITSSIQLSNYVTNHPSIYLSTSHQPSIQP